MVAGTGHPRAGVKSKLLGVALIVLGAMNSMLSWRAGVVVSNYYVILIVAGILLFGVGAIRGGRRS